MNQPQQPNQPGSAGSASSSNTGSRTSTSGSNGANDNTLLNQASQWLGQGNVSDLIGRLPESVQGLGNKAVGRFNQLTTTQKLVGGALLALGVGYLARSSSKTGNGAQGDYHGHASTDTSDTLHELLLFVNDRIEGYQRAASESKDTQRTGYYKQLVSQSQRFANELNDYLRRQGDDRETGTTIKGKLYRGWMDTKAALTGFDEESILGSNIYGEEWAIKAYKDALNSGSLSGSVRQAVERQYAQSQKTYQELKRMEGKK
ncbi:ferritin-like domain-containing protein [Hymenobacter sp. DG25B]|uniref:ferritin-like domain-containing protein n=1 Tax=Hymenobacter sp. DG25B TaxID=1385664 RepID=UPI00066265DB|nr:PA2169 family four-helix-bundle protein [Hymenobacter sp. DG25B]